MRIHGDLSVDDKAIGGIIEQVRKIVEATVADQISKLKSELETSKASPPAVIAPKGVDLPESERLKASDLRTALLLGKIPPDTCLLIDVKTTAKLLNVSERTVYRLVDQQAAPAPVRLGTLLRWRLTELIEWIDNGCPSRRQRSSSGRKRRRP